MENHAPSVTIDKHKDYMPWTFRGGKDPARPDEVVLHDVAKWFLDKAPVLNQGIGFCGVMTVKEKAPATIYLWPLQTPHTITAGVKKDVPGMTDLKPWPVDKGFPAWADTLINKPGAALKFFKQDDKNLHVIPEFNLLPAVTAHTQLQQAIQAISSDNSKGVSYIGFTLYYNLSYSGQDKNLTYSTKQCLLRCLSRSQNDRFFTAGGVAGAMPENWAEAIKQAFDDYFNLRKN